MWRRFSFLGRSTGLEMPCIPWEAAKGDSQYLQSTHNMYPCNVCGIEEHHRIARVADDSCT
jgi:hypothetical protein